MFELSLSKPAIAKPKKLKPLNKGSKNLAISLLEQQKPVISLEGLQTTADLEKDMKDYMDATKVFKQLKSAFEPPSIQHNSSQNESDEDTY